MDIISLIHWHLPWTQNEIQWSVVKDWVLSDTHWKSMGLLEISRVTWQVYWYVVSNIMSWWAVQKRKILCTIILHSNSETCWDVKYCFIRSTIDLYVVNLHRYNVLYSIKYAHGLLCIYASLKLHWVNDSTLQWRHDGHDGVSNHQPHYWLFRRRSKKTSKLRATGLCEGIHQWPLNSPHKWPVTRKMFPFDDVIMNFRKDNLVKFVFEVICIGGITVTVSCQLLSKFICFIF